MDRSTAMRVAELCDAAKTAAITASAFSGRNALIERRHDNAAREALATAMELIDGLDEPPVASPRFFAAACDITAVAA